MRTVLGYDEADRQTLVRHEDGTGAELPGSGPALLQMVYAYTADGIVNSITETDEVTVPGETITAVVSFEYDNRNRLTAEARTDSGGTGVPPVEYNLSYTYDLGGNRLTKCDWLTSEVTYYYCN